MLTQSHNTFTNDQPPDVFP